MHLPYPAALGEEKEKHKSGSNMLITHFAGLFK